MYLADMPYSKFSFKINCLGNAHLSRVYGSATDKFADTWNSTSKPNFALICHIQVKLQPSFRFIAYFGQNLVVMATSPRPLQSVIFSLDCPVMQSIATNLIR